MALPQIHRLPLRQQRQRMDQAGTPIYSSLFTIIKAPLPSDIVQARFAVLVSKKISPLAVVRNHLKRQILYAIQEILPHISPSDYLIIPKKNLQQSEFSQISLDLKRLLQIKQ